MIIGIGHDLVELERIEGILKGRTGPLFVARVLTPTEIELAQSRHGDALTPRWIEYLAGRFAVKEAVVKALGCGIGAMCGFQDIEIRADEAGKPHVQLSAKVYERLGLDMDHVSIHITITHTRGLASAMAVVEQERRAT